MVKFSGRGYPVNTDPINFPPKGNKPKFHVAGKCCCELCGKTNTTLYGKGDVKLCKDCATQQVEQAIKDGVIE